MRLAYFGTASFAVPTLLAVADSVSVVVTQPDRPSGRGLRLHPSPVKAAAIELGLPVLEPVRARSPEFVAEIASLGCDALLVAAYGQILSEALLATAKQGGINLHGSILPKYRGAAPIQRAILAGESETGVTLMQMDRGMDTGDMIATHTIRIGPDETYGDLETRLGGVAADMAAEWMPRIAAGDYARVPQDHSEATHAPKASKEEAKLDFFREGAEEYRRFRAFTPSPGAWLQTRFGTLRVSECRYREESGQPGEALQVKGTLLVGFGAGSIELLQVQPEGKKRLTGKDFANGARLKPGDRLVEG